MTEPFGGEPFRSSLLLVLCNRLLTAAVAASILVVRKHAGPRLALSLHNVCHVARWVRDTCWGVPCQGRDAATIATQEWGFPSLLHIRRCHTTWPVCIIQARGLDMRPAAPAYAYAAVSLSNVVATTCQYEALKYLTFPLQVKCLRRTPASLRLSVRAAPCLSCVPSGFAKPKP